jgi:hypothetical protein
MIEMVKKDDIDYEILVFSDEWFGLPFSCKHLLKHFLPDHPLIWVQTIGLRPPELSLYDIKRAIRKISKWIFSSKKNNSQEIPENLHIIDPIQIPYNHFSIIRKINREILIRALSQSQKRIRRPNRGKVFITTWPFMGNLVGHLGEKLSIYYRVDNFSELPGVQKKFINQLEKELIEKVDMVVATSEILTRIDIGNKPVKYLSHGVDFDHFSRKSYNNICKLPIQQIPSPRIGFFGLINSWIDFELLSLIASKNPRWSFVFIGPSQIPLSYLPNLPNMHFLGPVSYDELPKHAQYFDLGVIPFKINALTLSVNPIKLMEYFSIGIPVVSTPLPEVVKYREYVAIASGADGFGRAIRESLDGDNEKLREARQLVAKSNSWVQKSLRLRTWIEETLESKFALSK